MRTVNFSQTYYIHVVLLTCFVRFL